MTVQQATALQRSKHVRQLRAAIKLQMKRGRVDVRGLLLDPPDFMEGMQVSDFIAACPKVGTVKAGRIVQTARLRPTDRVGKIRLIDRCFLCSLLP